VGRGESITAQILVATPKMLANYIKKARSKSPPFDPRNVNVFVVDEADKMIEEESFKDNLISIKKGMPRHAQFVLCSATFADHVIKFADRHVILWALSWVFCLAQRGCLLYSVARFCLTVPVLPQLCPSSAEQTHTPPCGANGSKCD
jgi:hypothetical protein